MCIIVDNDSIQWVLLGPDDEKLTPLRKQLFGTKQPIQRLTYGGKLREEYLGNHKIKAILIELDRAGRTFLVPDESIQKEESRITWPCYSNDKHILALARVSKTRVLVSKDTALQRDFRNKKIIDNPRGKIYKNASHAPLLRGGCKL